MEFAPVPGGTFMMDSNLSMNVSSIPTHSIPLADDISMDFIKVMGGTFMMGNDKGGYEDERPVHPVFVQDFWIGVYPVTNEQYAVFLNDYGNGNVEAGKYAGKNMVKIHQWGMQYGAQGWFPAPGYEQHPATNITWYGAYTFGEWLSALTGKTFRLLHEAEWEYAAGGGYLGSNDSFLYSGSNKLDDVGWYETNSHDEIKQVGLKQPNQLGLYDMSGNIGEWCMDHWHDDYTGAPMDGTAWLSDDESEYRVVRGGCYYHQERYCRVTSRSGDIPEDCGDDQGFRICEKPS